MNLNVHCVNRFFDREKIISGDPFFRGVEEIAADVRCVLDYERFNGKYARAFLTSEDTPRPVTDHPHLQEKALTFQYVRIES